jgi:hypothetical protein
MLIRLRAEKHERDGLNALTLPPMLPLYETPPPTAHGSTLFSMTTRIKFQEIIDNSLAFLIASVRRSTCSF